MEECFAVGIRKDFQIGKITLKNLILLLMCVAHSADPFSNCVRFSWKTTQEEKNGEEIFCFLGKHSKDFCDLELVSKLGLIRAEENPGKIIDNIKFRRYQFIRVKNSRKVKKYLEV